MLRSARRQEGEILVDEAIVRALVDTVEGVHEAIAERIRVDIERRMNEVRDIGPEGFVAGTEPDRRAEALVLHRHPQFAELVGCQLAVAALQVHFALEGVEGDLAHDRVDHVLDFRRQHRLALDRLRGLVEEAAEGQHLAEHARGLGQRQRRRCHQGAVGGRQHLMDAVAEFMRERHHVPRLALIVQQHVRMRRRHGGMREGAGRFAGARRRIDPALAEEAPGDIRHFRREIRIGGQDGVFRLGPRDGPLIDLGQRRVAIPMIELVLAEPPRLQLVVAVRQARIGLLHGRHQRLHRFAFDAIGEVARIRHVLETAPAIGDFLVLRERVGDEREVAQVCRQRLGEGLGGVLAHGLVGILHLVQGRLDGEFLAAHIEPQRRDGLVEEAVPGAAAGHRLFMKELLDLVVELIRLVLAQILDPGPVMGERLPCHRRVEDRVVDAVQFQPEEQQLA